MEGFILTVIHEAFLFVDGDKVLFANRAFEDLCEASSQDIVQEREVALLAPREKAFFFLECRRCWRERQ